MKSLVLAALLITSSAFADDVTLVEKKGKATLILQGGLKGTANEIVGIIGRAHKEGYKDSKGTDFFVKEGNGGMGNTAYINKLLTASTSSGITVSYSIVIKANRKDSISMIDAKTILVKGEAANILEGALNYSASDLGNQPVGSYRTESKSGKISCSHTVVRRPVASCIIRL